MKHETSVDRLIQALEDRGKAIEELTQAIEDRGDAIKELAEAIEKLKLKLSRKK